MNRCDLKLEKEKKFFFLSFLPFEWERLLQKIEAFFLNIFWLISWFKLKRLFNFVILFIKKNGFRLDESFFFFFLKSCIFFFPKFFFLFFFPLMVFLSMGFFYRLCQDIFQILIDGNPGNIKKSKCQEANDLPKAVKHLRSISPPVNKRFRTSHFFALFWSLFRKIFLSVFLRGLCS